MIRLHSLYFILIAFNIFGIQSLKIYESTFDLEDKIAGKTDYQHLKYSKNAEDDNINWESGLTACLRFNYKRIFDPAILWIGNGIFDKDEDNLKNHFIGMKIIPEFPVSWFEYKNDNVSFHMILSNSYTKQTTSVNRWHHLCIGIDPNQSQALIVLVSFGLSSKTLRLNR